MAWIENKPLKIVGNRIGRDILINEITISFCVTEYTKRKVTLTIYIGNNIADKINLKKGDRLNFFIDEQNSRKWMIQKSDSIDEGYKLSETYGKEAIFSRIVFKQDIQLDKSDFIKRPVKIEFENENIIILADQIKE